MKKIILAFILLLFTGCIFKRRIDSYYNIVIYDTFVTIRDIYNDKDYVEIDNLNSYNEFLDNFNSINKPNLDNEFFNDKKLIIIRPNIGVEIQELTIDKEVNIKVYFDCPLMREDEKMSENLIMIPVSKDIDKINYSGNCFPDRIY